MSDDTPHNDPWNAPPSGDAFETDEEAVYAPEPDEEIYEQDWDNETDDLSSDDDFDLTTEEDDVDASFYEPPAPPITDAELEPDEPPESDDNWWRENWWRLGIVILLVLAIIFLLARACTGKTEKPIPTPIVEVTRSALPTFTPTVAALPTTALESGEEAATNGGATPASPATQPPPVATTAPSAATGKFTIGQTVVVTGTGKDKLSFRAGPGTDYKRTRVIKDGVKLTVISGPEKANGFTWWQLKAPNGQVGWAVEDYLEPLQ